MAIFKVGQTVKITDPSLDEFFLVEKLWQAKICYFVCARLESDCPYIYEVKAIFFDGGEAQMYIDQANKEKS